MGGEPPRSMSAPRTAYPRLVQENKFDEKRKSPADPLGPIYYHKVGQLYRLTMINWKVVMMDFMIQLAPIFSLPKSMVSRIHLFLTR